jgi:filamentous hemagglutinin
VKITYKDGTKFDMTRSRVKETEINPYVQGGTRPVKFDNALNKQGTKRAPSLEELNWFNSIDW